MTTLRTRELYRREHLESLTLTTNKLMRAFLIVVFTCAGLSIANAQTFTSLLSFNGSDGAFPQATLALAADGNFYGTTPFGGATGCGNVEELSTSGNVTSLFNFDCTDGQLPYLGVIRGRDGNFYGVTSFWGSNGMGGTIFEVTANGELTTLYNFCSKTNCSDGSTSYSELTQAFDGNFYGATSAGGQNGQGTIFRITPGGKLTTLYSFCLQKNCIDGSAPFGRLAQAFDGNFYGTTWTGGVSNQGTVFSITREGKLTTLYSFCSAANCTDGAAPMAGLMQGSNGHFYGTTSSGGTDNKGTVFEITPEGRLTILHSFTGVDGAEPYAAVLVEGAEGNFYGTTYTGGASTTYGFGGTIYRMTPSGELTTLYSFCAEQGCVDGRGPIGGLTLGADGDFYGTTAFGGIYGTNNCGVYGNYGCGTFFRLKGESSASEQ
jgi:uncharacterized repeat protein (TIGR03803 family)